MDTLTKLTDFLLNQPDYQPVNHPPLIITADLIRVVYTNPPPTLIKALQERLRYFLREVTPESWGEIKLSTSTFGLALAFYTCSAQPQNQAITHITQSLIDSLPPAETLETALAYHAVLGDVGQYLPNLSASAQMQLHTLIEKSPLTALTLLAHHRPLALDATGEMLLVGWQPDATYPHVWPTTEAWLDVVLTCLNHPALARWLQQRWLALPETHLACLNLGLLLETLYQTGEQQSFLFTFYEAYDYFKGEIDDNGQRHWPVLQTIATFLRLRGNDDVIRQLNRRGNAYFLKFRPLLQLIVDEGRIPTNYRHLTLTFVTALQQLVPYVTQKSRVKVAFEPIVFES